MTNPISTVICFLLFLIAVAIARISPQPQPRSRFVVIAIILTLTWRYLSWRTANTINLNSWGEGFFSVGLYFLEVGLIFNSSLQLFLTIAVKDNRGKRDKLAKLVISGEFQPSVDIFIPTYDEPEFILRRTVIGCQALEYKTKKIYLLDDSRRNYVKQLARELNCNYISRQDNKHAKAGNINHALPLTKGEFITFFDADFIPTTNFLERTLGLFQDDNLALVQTPQSFYNIDPIARNLGLAEILTPEEEVFYRQLQPIKDAAGSVVCAGTSFVVRRKALESIGGFVTDSLSEDYFTGIRLCSQGYRLTYIDEKLSAGLAAESIGDQVEQRLRWARGTLQAFFIRDNPLTITGLNSTQRLAHFEGLLHRFLGISKALLLLLPFAYTFDLVPIEATISDFLAYFLPYYLARTTTFGWLNYRSRSAVLSEVYSLIIAFPQAITVIQTLLNPFEKGFNVTPKGTKQDRYSYNWKLALPLIFLLVLTGLSWGINLAKGIYLQSLGAGLGWLWSGLNAISISCALLALRDLPRLTKNEEFTLRKVVRLKAAETNYWGVSLTLGQDRAEIEIENNYERNKCTHLKIDRSVDLTIVNEEIHVQGLIETIDKNKLTIKFEQIKLEEERKLIKLLYCQPGQWQNKISPGEIHSLSSLLNVILVFGTGFSEYTEGKMP